MTDETLIEMLKALAHPVRMRIMRALIAGERNVGEIEEAAGIGQPTLSQQLAVLRQAGLVATRREGKLVHYSIEDARFAAITQALRPFAGAAPAEPAAARARVAGAANFARLG